MTGAELTREDWNEFHRTVLRPVPVLAELAQDEAIKPGCNDAPFDAGPDTPTIVSRFWTSRSFADLSTFVDPRNWERLGSPYWKQMKAVEGPRFTTDGYTAVFREVVLLPTGPITVYLDVTFRNDDHSALTTFCESFGRNSQVSLDRGHVFATDRTVSPDGTRATLVYSTKSIVFTDDVLNGLTGLACDNGWVDMMIRMALPPERGPNVAHDGGHAQGSSTPTQLDLWAQSARDLVDRYVATARTGIGALRVGRWDADLLDELLSVGDHTTATVKQAARAWREIVGSLADAGRQP